MYSTQYACTWIQGIVERCYMVFQFPVKMQVASFYFQNSDARKYCTNFMHAIYTYMYIIQYICMQPGVNYKISITITHSITRLL